MAAGAGALALKPVLHVIGCGRVGRALARSWSEAGTLDIGRIVNRSARSASDAAAFIGAGTPATGLGACGPGDWLMFAAPDGALAALVERAASDLRGPPALAFHVSGAEPAELLRPLGCPVAAVHPVCPFSDPERAVRRLPGSHALGEGDERALDRVLAAFEAIGATVDRFHPVDKRRYHAAAIAASNFLNVLDDLALQLAEEGGLARERALPVLVSLQRIALDNIEQAGPAGSLTGPIERRDRAMCARLGEVLRDARGDREGVLLALARAAVHLAGRKRGQGGDADRLLDLFADDTTVRGERRDAGV